MISPEEVGYARPMPSDERHIDLRTAAAELGVHYQTAYRWVRTGRLPAALVDGRYLVLRSDVEAVRERRETPRAPTPPSPRRLTHQSDRMHVALVDGDETRARSIGRTLVEQGTPVSTLIQEVLVPALRRIGDAWRAGELPISVEHRASAITERLLGELAPNPRGRRRGTALVAALSGDMHALPTSMAAVALREHNWHVHHLGADMPPAELLRFCATDQVDVAVITVTNPDCAEMAERTARALRDTGTATIVGGPGRSLDELVERAEVALVP